MAGHIPLECLLEENPQPVRIPGYELFRFRRDPSMDNRRIEWVTEEVAEKIKDLFNRPSRSLFVQAEDLMKQKTDQEFASAVLAVVGSGTVSSDSGASEFEERLAELEAMVEAQKKDITSLKRQVTMLKK